MKNAVTFPLPSGMDYGLYTNLLDYWTPDHTNAFYPRLYPLSGYNQGTNTEVQTKYLFNAAYLDIRSVVLSYSISPSLLKKANISNFSVFVSCENLWSFNHFPKGIHPDSQVRGIASGVSSGGSTYPVMRELTAGFNMSF